MSEKILKATSLPTVEQIEREKAVGLTKYTPGEVLTVLAELRAANDEAAEVYVAVTEWLKVNAVDYDDAGWQLSEVNAVAVAVWSARQTLFANVKLGRVLGGGRGRTSGENYPLSKWTAEARKLRTASKRMRAVLAKL